MDCFEIRGSHLDLFDRCSYAYYLSQVDRRPPDIKVPKWAVLGWVVHRALEIAMITGNEASRVFSEKARSYREICQDEWASQWPDVPLAGVEIPAFDPAMMQRGLRMMANFELLRKKLLYRLKNPVVEHSFRVFIDEDQTLCYRGRLDVSGDLDGDLLILDYKSGKPEWENSEVTPQLLRYAIAMAIEKQIPISSIQTILFNLESGSAFQKRWTREDASKMIASMIDKMVRIESAKSYPGVVGNHCRNLCGYAPSCPFYNGSRR